MRLYSRDDVWGPLRLQFQLVEALRAGWRPLTPQSRGARPPLPEPPVSLEGPAVCPPALQAPPVLPVAGSPEQPPAAGSSTSGSSFSESEASEAPEPTQDSAGAGGLHSGALSSDLLLVNNLTGVYHAAIPSDESTPEHRRAHAGAGWWRAACGACLPREAGAIAVGASAPFSALPCCRAACARLLEGAPRRVPAAAGV